MVRAAQAARACAAAAALLAAGHAALGQQEVCTDLGIASCNDKNETCYWASQLEEASCKPIPEGLELGVCVCTVPQELGGCGSEREGGSGCEPSRFCAYVRGCQVINVALDTDCYADGRGTSRCVPTDYCKYENNLIPGFGDGDCVRNGRSPPIYAPPESTPRPTSSPVETAPTPKPTPEAALSSGLIIGIAGGSSALVVALCAFCLCWRSWNASDSMGETPDHVKNVLVDPSDILVDPREQIGRFQDDGLVDLYIADARAASAASDDPNRALAVHDADVLVGLADLGNGLWQARDAEGNVGLVREDGVTLLPRTPVPASLEDDEPEF